MSQHSLDFSMVGTPSAEALATTRDSAAKLAEFAAEVRATIARLRPQRFAAGGAPNQVEVQPGGKTFATITEALDSITDASMKKQYVCYIGPGTYAENVTCKSWVFLQGEGPDQTFVNGIAGSDFNNKGTVIGAANSAVQSMSILSKADGWGTFTTAVAVGNAVNFDIENCLLTATDPLGGGNIWALTIDYQGGQSGSVVNIAYTTVLAQVTAGDSQPIALLAAAGSAVLLTESKLVSQGGVGGWGGASNGGSTVTLDSCYVEGVGYSLNIPDYTSTCIANQCQLNGPVASGVVVNP